MPRYWFATSANLESLDGAPLERSKLELADSHGGVVGVSLAEVGVEVELGKNNLQS